MKMATSVVMTCRVTVPDCRVYIVLVWLQRFTPSEEFFTKELPVWIYCCLGCTYRDMGNSLSFLDSGFKTGLASTVMFETCSVLSQSSVEVPHKRFKIKDIKLNKPFNWFREVRSIFFCVFLLAASTWLIPLCHLRTWATRICTTISLLQCKMLHREYRTL